MRDGRAQLERFSELWASVWWLAPSLLVGKLLNTPPPLLASSISNVTGGGGFKTAPSGLAKGEKDNPREKQDVEDPSSASPLGSLGTSNLTR